MVAANEDQKKRYMEPYANGEMRSNIAISEPHSGADPSAMKTRAVKDGDEWVINGRKIWISGAAGADFIILMAVTDPDLGARGGITAFIVEKDTPGYIIERPIPMLGGVRTYELVFDDMRLPDSQVSGEVGRGYAPMQHRLTSRRLEIGSTCIAFAERALRMMCEHTQTRVVFGEPLASKQAIQWWIADAEIALHATRLMVADAAAKVDRGEDIRNEASMLKVFATEMANDVIDKAQQSFGALGMTQEFPLHHMAQQIRMSANLRRPVRGPPHGRGPPSSRPLPHLVAATRLRPATRVAPMNEANLDVTIGDDYVATVELREPPNNHISVAMVDALIAAGATSTPIGGAERSSCAPRASTSVPAATSGPRVAAPPSPGQEKVGRSMTRPTSCLPTASPSLPPFRAPLSVLVWGWPWSPTSGSALPRPVSRPTSPGSGSTTDSC